MQHTTAMKACRQRAQRRGKPTSKPTRSQAWLAEKLICTAPVKLAGVLEGRSRPHLPPGVAATSVFKKGPAALALLCILRCDTQCSVMWLENPQCFTVPLWWLKKEGRTHQWTNRDTETKNISTMNRNHSSCN